MPISHRARVMGRIAAFVLGTALCLVSGAVRGVDVVEAQLFDAIDRFVAGDRPAAFDVLSALTANHPRFRAARLIHESLLEADNVRAALEDLTPRAPVNPLEDSTDEAYSRLTYWFERPPRGFLPDVVIEAAAFRTKVLVADTRRSRLYLFERVDGGWERRGDWYASIGRGGTAKRREGDEKTPLGVYFVTMWVPGQHLSEFYGAGALGLNYPNAWDLRRNRDGYGIWIHGEPRIVSTRAPRWTLGCLAISNPALTALAEELDGQSIPVIIGERIRWLAPGEHERHRKEWLARIASRHGGNIASRELGVYRYPVAAKESAMLLVEFRSTLAGGRPWRQYWREDAGGNWRVVHESPAAFSEVHFEGLPKRLQRNGVQRYAP